MIKYVKANADFDNREFYYELENEYYDDEWDEYIYYYTVRNSGVGPFYEIIEKECDRKNGDEGITVYVPSDSELNDLLERTKYHNACTGDDFYPNDSIDDFVSAINDALNK